MMPSIFIDVSLCSCMPLHAFGHLLWLKLALHICITHAIGSIPYPSNALYSCLSLDLFLFLTRAQQLIRNLRQLNVLHACRNTRFLFIKHPGNDREDLMQFLFLEPRACL